MINPNLSECNDCSNIRGLIDDINCRLFELAMSSYRSIIYGFGDPIKFILTHDLLCYRRILEYKTVNSDYVGEISVDEIASKVRVLISKI